MRESISSRFRSLFYRLNTHTDMPTDTHTHTHTHTHTPSTHPEAQSVQSLSRVRWFATPWTSARQASLSITNSRSLLRFMAIALVMPSNHLTLFIPFSSCLQSLPASGSFPKSRFFASGGQTIGVSASASVLPMNTQD